jgi:carbohydrate kinase (thermoresistant glucokinase family)
MIPPVIIVVMGVCGSGKTVVGKALAKALGGRFVEGDDFHPQANVDKMRAGTPLTDADRAGWLDNLARELAAATGPTVLACSALKETYRQRLRDGAAGPVAFAFLDAPRTVIERRVGARKGHFMPTSLIDSQFATLEPPPDAIRLDATRPVAELVATVVAVVGG